MVVVYIELVFEAVTYKGPLIGCCLYWTHLWGSHVWQMLTRVTQFYLLSAVCPAEHHHFIIIPQRVGVWVAVIKYVSHCDGFACCDCFVWPCSCLVNPKVTS